MPTPILMPPRGPLHHQHKDAHDTTCWPYDDSTPLELEFTADGTLSHTPHDFFKDGPYKGDGKHKNRGKQSGGMSKADGKTVTFSYDYGEPGPYVIDITFEKDCNRL